MPQLVATFVQSTWPAEPTAGAVAMPREPDFGGGGKGRLGREERSEGRGTDVDNGRTSAGEWAARGARRASLGSADRSGAKKLMVVGVWVFVEEARVRAVEEAKEQRRFRCAEAGRH